jgi:hypothetical protein
VARYAQDERLVPLPTQGQALKAGVLVFIGAPKALFRPWPSDTPSQAPMARQTPPKAPGRQRGPAQAHVCTLAIRPRDPRAGADRRTGVAPVELQVENICSRMYWMVSSLCSCCISRCKSGWP